MPNRVPAEGKLVIIYREKRDKDKDMYSWDWIGCLDIGLNRTSDLGAACQHQEPTQCLEARSFQLSQDARYHSTKGGDRGTD